jgi:putative protein kinase ArgK-like GTPase of G3E family
MTDMDKNAVLIKEVQTRIDRKLKESEIEIVEHWKEQIDRVTAMKPEGIAALQQQLKNISEMMNNRLRILKREFRG